MINESPWGLGSSPKYPPFLNDDETDVLIIGGGITGVTAAYLLATSGKRVTLLEKNILGSGETHRTTAHISYPTDVRMTALTKSFGRNHAEGAWDSQLAAAEQIVKLVRVEGLSCGLRTVPGYLYASSGKDADSEIDQLQNDARLARELGFDARYIDPCPLSRRPAVIFANLRKFHPLLYIGGVASAAEQKGCRLFEASEVTEFNSEENSVTCNGFVLRYKHLFIATHVPLQGNANSLSAALLQTKLIGYSTYAVKARLEHDIAQEALWWDTSDPYFYLRVDRDEEGLSVIVGGEDHKTGTVEDTEGCYRRLISKMHALLPCARVENRWSGQVIETVDGLPYIGVTKDQFIATGFSGTGITFGTLAGMMFHDHVMEITNPWTELFKPDRKKLSETWNYIRENKDYPYYLVKGLFAASSQSERTLAPGEGAILRYESKKVAAYKDQNGHVTLLSPVCPHLGCTVAWNAAEQTWDCPCHGSRFSAKGEVISGPAETALEALHPDKQ
jgi:glycine/D-amino acid oxidase-like deaminating enzyme/nitrite reductase/ring-hydroxylating ferredoxin subunit